MSDNLLDEESFRDQATQDGITHISTGVAIARDGKILVVRRAASDFLGGSYELPGGGVDDGETIAESAAREVKEETGLTVIRTLGIFDGFDYATDKKPHVRQVNFLVEVRPGDPVLDPNEHDAWQWVTESDLSGVEMTENMRTCIRQAFALLKSK